MDEYDSGMDPEVRRYFKKIMNSFFLTILWLLSVATAGLYFRLGIIDGGWQWYHVVFYLVGFATLVLLLRKLYRIWK